MNPGATRKGVSAKGWRIGKVHRHIRTARPRRRVRTVSRVGRILPVLVAGPDLPFAFAGSEWRERLWMLDSLASMHAQRAVARSSQRVLSHNSHPLPFAL